MKKNRNIVECKSLGIPLPEGIARQVDNLTRVLPKDCTYRRKSITPQASELVDEQRADISLVSTEAIDRQGDIVLAKGVDTNLFTRNPVVTFAHKYDELPVGKCEWIRKVEGGIKAKTKYADRPDDWQGQWFPSAVWSLVKQGCLQGKSIGFLPTKIRAATSDEISRNPTWKDAGSVIESAVLLEYAIAVIPVNQEAIVEAVSKGANSAALLKRLGLKTPEKKDTKERMERLLRYLAGFKIDPDEVLKSLRDKYRV